MTKSALEFDPFSQEFFDDPYEVYRWMRTANLHADRDKIPAAVEELLRYDNPVQYDVRRSMRDVTLHGMTIPAHKPVFLMLASANRDPEVWTDADRFDIDRDVRSRRTSGSGTASTTAWGRPWLEWRAPSRWRNLLTFMPRYEVDWDGCKRVHMTNVVGWYSVPVRINRRTSFS